MDEQKTCIPPITGYRQLTNKEVQLMNAIKAEGMSLSGLIDRVVEGGVNADPRWVAIARTELQQGLMALTRAVAKPEGF